MFARGLNLPKIATDFTASGARQIHNAWPAELNEFYFKPNVDYFGISLAEEPFSCRYSLPVLISRRIEDSVDFF